MFARILDNLYRCRNICNVYVMKDETRALLIDLGTGSVVDRLGDICGRLRRARGESSTAGVGSGR